ncbi:ORF6N domain-containing protein [Candidatus Saccharibacteria bacterium]|nr:ORF6N domain-containing protein [Candidatus Saccharibacteria bacterium]
MNDLVVFDNIEENLLEIQGKQVLIDADVARIFEVETKHVNQAVKNNHERFPAGYVLILDKSEKLQLVKNFDRFSNLKYSTADTLAFTEKGLYMLATILKSPRAIRATINIIETFASLREFGRTLNMSTDSNISPAKRKKYVERSTELIKVILDDAMANSIEKETSLELNLAMVKLKHSIKTTKPRSAKKKEDK